MQNIVGPLLESTNPDESVGHRALKRFVIDDSYAEPTFGGVQQLAIADDGNRIIFAGQGDAGRQIFLRSLDSLEAVPVRYGNAPLDAIASTIE
jgi:hypothetical protein